VNHVGPAFWAFFLLQAPNNPPKAKQKGEHLFTWLTLQQSCALESSNQLVKSLGTGISLHLLPHLSFGGEREYMPWAWKVSHASPPPLPVPQLVNFVFLIKCHWVSLKFFYKVWMFVHF
jgi:hypothetical protein